MTTTHFLLSAIAFVFLAIFGEGLCLLVARFMFACLTLGIVRVQNSEEASVSFPWHGFARNASGRLIVKADTADLYAALLLVVAIALAISWRAGAFAHA